MDIKLNKDEQEILKSYQEEEWSSVDSANELIEQYQRYAKESQKKDKRIDIRISSIDLLEIRKLAAREKIPYQTYVSSIIHKFINGTLV